VTFIKCVGNDFWETLLKVDQTEDLNKLIANQQQGMCALMMGEERERAKWRFEERL